MKFKGTVAAFADYVQYYLGFQVHDKSLFHLGVDPFSGVHLCFLPLCCEDSYKSFKISGGSFLHNWEKKLCRGKLRRFGLWSQRELKTSSLSFSTIFAITTYNMVYFGII